MKTPTERTSEWRKAKMAQGWRQKALFLSPNALALLDAVRPSFESEAAAVERALADLHASLTISDQR